MEEELLVNSAESAYAMGSVVSAVYATLGIFSIVIAIALYILLVIAYWKIFTKAGKPGWHSIIPVLNSWDEIDLSWNRPMAWFSICLTVVSSIVSIIIQNRVVAGLEVPGFLPVLSYVIVVVAVIFGIICTYKLAKAFGKGFGFFLGLIFLRPIFMLILGFGSAQYQGRQG